MKKLSSLVAKGLIAAILFTNVFYASSAITYSASVNEPETAASADSKESENNSTDSEKPKDTPDIPIVNESSNDTPADIPSQAEQKDAPVQKALPDSEAESHASQITITHIDQLIPYFPDAAFRQAVFDAVSNDSSAAGTDVKDALNNYLGDIIAKKEGIKDITGIDLLRKANVVNLTGNEIKDFSNLGLNVGTPEEFNTWYGLPTNEYPDRESGSNVHWILDGNPFEKLPVDFGGALDIKQPGSSSYTYPEDMAAHYVYVRPEGNDDISGTINIAKTKVVNKKAGTERNAKLNSVSWNRHNVADSKLAEFKIDSFDKTTYTTADFSGLKKAVLVMWRWAPTRNCITRPPMSMAPSHPAPSPPNTIYPLSSAYMISYP